jgi:hypothetical protein
MATALPPGERSLDYADPSRVERTGNPDRLLHVALICALLPTCSGTIAIVSWLATRAPVFQLIGFFTILGGCLLFVVGIITWAAYLYRAWSIRLPINGKRLALAALAVIVLLGNFPLCALYTKWGSLSRLKVQNNSGATVANIVLTKQSGNRTQLGSLAPGTSSSHWFDVGGSDWLTATASVGAATASDTVDSAGDMPGKDYTITFNADGTVTIR